MLEKHAAMRQSMRESANLGERERGSLAIVVTEMATNVVKHAGTGTILVEAVTGNGSSGVRVLALDKGPGIRDLSGALRDGYSTAGTAGNGLGAMKRLSNAFDIYTAPGLGTAVLSEFWPQKRKQHETEPDRRRCGFNSDQRGRSLRRRLGSQEDVRFDAAHGGRWAWPWQCWHRKRPARPKESLSTRTPVRPLRFCKTRTMP